MATIAQILDDLHRGVDDQTWIAYAQQLTTLGAQPLQYDVDARGSNTYEIPTGPGHAVHVERGPDGVWHLA